MAVPAVHAAHPFPYAVHCSRTVPVSSGERRRCCSTARGGRTSHCNRLWSSARLLEAHRPAAHEFHWNFKIPCSLLEFQNSVLWIEHSLDVYERSSFLPDALKKNRHWRSGRLCCHQCGLKALLSDSSIPAAPTYRDLPDVWTALKPSLSLRPLAINHAPSKECML